MLVRELVTRLGFEVERSKIREFDRQIGEMKKNLRETTRNINEVGNSLIGLGGKFSTFLTLPLALIGGFTVKAASDAEEMQNKFNQVFKGLEDDAQSFAESFAESVGRATDEVQEGLSTYQSFFIGLGFGKEKAFEMSKEMQKLAVDFGSFNNLADEDSLQRFISAMSGSPEVLARFGINLKAPALELKLLELGLAGSVTEATEMEKSIARLEIIKDALGSQGAIGDAVRTLGDFANRVRQTRSLIKALAIDFGRLLLPPLNKFLGLLNGIIKRVKETSKETKRFIIVVATIAAAIGPVLIVVGLLVKTFAFMSMALIAIKAGFLAATGSAITFNAAALLMPAIFIAVAVALAFLINEIYVWVNDGDSIIGKLLGPWEEWRDTMVGFLQGVGSAIYNLVHGEFDELYKKAKFIAKVFGFFFKDLFGGDEEEALKILDEIIKKQKTPFEKRAARTGAQPAGGPFGGLLPGEISRSLHGVGPGRTSRVNNIGNITLNTEVVVPGGAAGASPQEIADTVNMVVEEKIQETIVTNLGP